MDGRDPQATTTSTTHIAFRGIQRASIGRQRSRRSTRRLMTVITPRNHTHPVRVSASYPSTTDPYSFLGHAADSLREKGRPALHTRGDDRPADASKSRRAELGTSRRIDGPVHSPPTTPIPSHELRIKRPHEPLYGYFARYIRPTARETTTIVARRINETQYTVIPLQNTLQK